MKLIQNARDEEVKAKLAAAMALLEQASDVLGDDETYEIANALENAKKRLNEAREDLDQE